MKKWWITSCVLLALAALCGTATAMEIGQKAGAVALVNLDGHPRTMNHYADYVCTAVVFLSARSEDPSGWVEPLCALLHDESMEDVLFAGICPNPQETGAEVKRFCQCSGLIMPVYRDPEGKAARQFDATVTPECFLLDPRGRLVYRGGIEALKPAIEALLAETPVDTPKTEAKGTPIGKPGPERPLENPYGHIAFSSELIFTEVPGMAVCHCSTIAEAPNGDLLCLWYGGSYESAEDQALYLARRKPGECAWSAPEAVLRNPDMPPGNALLFKDTANKLWMVWGRMEGARPTPRGSGWSKCQLMSRISTDNGYTWDNEREWPDAFGMLPRNPPTVLQDGSLVLPMSDSSRDPREPDGTLLRLLPDGVSWEKLGTMLRAEQMSVVQCAKGDLFALARSKPYLLASTSMDLGKTWSPTAPTTLKCPDSGAVMIRLASGRFLLAHNDNDGEDRAILALQISEDEGRTWGNKKYLEYEPNLTAGEYSYPCLIQASDGMIHITYTFRRYAIKHAAFNEDYLLHVERPN